MIVNTACLAGVFRGAHRGGGEDTSPLGRFGVGRARRNNSALSFGVQQLEMVSGLGMSCMTKGYFID